MDYWTAQHLLFIIAHLSFSVLSGSSSSGYDLFTSLYHSIWPAHTQRHEIIYGLLEASGKHFALPLLSLPLFAVEV
jgi:hypothetical protein